MLAEHLINSVCEGIITQWGSSKVFADITSKRSREYQVLVSFVVGEHGFDFLFTVYRHRIKEFIKPELIRVWQLHKGQRVNELPSRPRALVSQLPKGMYAVALKQAAVVMKDELDKARLR